jgi:hypothetical protein
MGVLRQTIKDHMGGDISDTSLLVNYFKESTEFMYSKYQKPDRECSSISISSIQNGHFYFFMYQDESNWMQFAPVFLCDWKKFDNKIIGYAVNFNFIPIEYRVAVFDVLINNLEDSNQLTSMTFEMMYRQLLKVGYEYALVEFDFMRLKRVYHIQYEILPDFLCSTYPTIKYDPQNLYNIWKVKLETKEARHQEMIKMISDEFYNATEDISEKYSELKSHMKRLKRNNEKYGK